MRKFICAVLAFVLCASLALPAFAAFTPSVAVKETPVVSTVVANNGKEVTNEEGLKAVATIVTADGAEEEETHVFEGSVVIITVSDAKAGKQTDKTDEKLTKQEKEIQKDLKKVYDDMEKGKLEIPYAEVGLKAEKMVVRELFSLTFHPADKHTKEDGTHFAEALKDEDTSLRMTLDLGVAKGDKIYIMVYTENEDGKKVWQKMEAVNNGDGTITVDFTALGVVAVCIEQ